MAEQEIKDIPEIPPEIFDAINSRSFAVFIGAGVSRLVGCSSWPEISSRLISCCYNQLGKDGKKLLSFKEKEFLHGQSAKKAITICKGLLEQNDLISLYEQELKGCLHFGTKLPGNSIYDEIYRLRGLNLTTNVDDRFHPNYTPEKIKHLIPDLKISDLIIKDHKETNLYHLHGCLLDAKSMVFTVTEYIERYNDSQFTNFLKKVFAQYTVLFIGYGLEELEVLDYVMSKIQRKKKSDSRDIIQRILLLPVFKDDGNILRHEKSYYADLGIKVVAFPKDINGYDQLTEVIRDWAKQIEGSTTFLQKTFESLEEIVQNPNLTNQKLALQYIKNDLPMREKFFNLLTDTAEPAKWLSFIIKNGFLAPQNNPAPIISDKDKKQYSMPFWDALGFLENLSKRNEQVPDPKITRQIKKFIANIMEYKGLKGKRVENYRTDWVVFKTIFRLPNDAINSSHLRYIGIFISSQWHSVTIASDLGSTAFPKLLASGDKRLVAQLLKLSLGYEKDSRPSGQDYRPLIESYWLSECLDLHLKDIVNLIGLDCLKIILSPIKEITSKDRRQFNCIWIKSIENPRQFSDRLDSILINSAKICIEFIDSSLLKSEVKKLLRAKHPIFTRLGIYAIKHHYPSLKSLFWSWAKNTKNPLLQVDLKHEIFTLIKTCSSQLSKKEIKIILSWIEDIKATREGLTPEQKRQAEAYRKREWLLALADTKDKNVQELAEKYNSINSAEISHPGYSSWMETRWRSPNSPIEPQDLVSKTPNEIIKFLKDFKENPNDWDAPTKGALCGALTTSVKLNPIKISKLLSRIAVEVDQTFLEATFRGFTEAWNDKKSIPWKDILENAFRLVSDNIFWKTPSDKHLLVRAISELIRVGTTDDDNAFPANLLGIAEKIVLIFVEKVESGIGDSSDIVTAVLNSTLGYVYQATINVALRYARLKNTDGPCRWPETIKTAFSKKLTGPECPPEMSVILGEYIRQFLYLDEPWYMENLSKIYDQRKPSLWKAAMSGYLFYSQVLVFDVYKIMIEAGNYDLAIKTDFGGSNVNDRVVQHACLAYLEDVETFENSLLKRVIELNTYEHNNNIVQFLTAFRKKSDKNYDKKLKKIWSILAENASKNLMNPDSKKLLAELVYIFGVFNEIDAEIVELVKISYPYVEPYGGLLHFAEYFKKYITKSPELIADLFQDMASKGILLSYQKEDIVKIIETLFQKGFKSQGIKICNGYLVKNIEYVRPLLDKYAK